MPLQYRIVLLVLALSATVAQAQRALGPDPSANRPGVFVRDSAVAGEKLALAQRMERLKEWDKSADVYQEIVEKYSDRVVPARTEGDAQRYTSVLLAVQERLGQWPAEGLAVYRARYETPAATMLEAVVGDDVGALNRVVQLYFPTDAARTAAMRLMELYLENGEFTAAAWLGERLLANHPGIDAQRPDVIFRTALALQLSGNAAAAKAKLDDLKNNHAAATSIVRGKDVNLATELTAMLEGAAPATHGGSADSWPVFGGDATRGRVPDAQGKPGALVAVINIPRPRQLRPADRQQLRLMNEAAKDRRETGMSLGTIPSIDRGELFYQDNNRIYAKTVESGLTLPGWPSDVSEKRYAQPGTPVESTAQMTVTVTDTSVLAILGQSGRITMTPDGAPVQTQPNTRLVCHDRTSGAERWVVSPKELPAQPAALRELDFTGSPLVTGDNVYIAARGGKPMQFEDAYVLCFSLSDGRLRWSCYLASGNAPDGNYPAALMQNDSASHLAYAGGRVYASTDLGAVASIDAYAGTIAWLTLYPKPLTNINNFMAMQLQGNGQLPASRKPWAQNPVIVKEGKVFALPSDAEQLFIYDAADGHEQARIAMSDFQNADTLLGVVDDKLIVCSTSRVYCINWPKYDAGKSAQQNVHWIGMASGPGAGPEKENEDAIRGRGFVTTQSVFVPTRWGLKRIALRNGRVEEDYPRDGTWPSGEGPGNVLVTQDQVIVAGADLINVYSDLALARAKLDRAVEAAPKDPLPRMKYAETLFAAGQIEPAVQKLDEAIGLLGGLNNMRRGAERDRAFSRALAFAERAAEPKVGASNPELANSLFDRAMAAADSPAQQVTYRLSRARFTRAERDFVGEVRLYQEILENGAYRSVQVPSDDQATPLTAGQIAEISISERLRDYPAAYAPYEQTASATLAKAKQANDPQQMLDVALMYPNAKVAPQAMFAAAEVYEAADKHRTATQVLNQLYRKYRDGSDKPRVIEALARNYLALPGRMGIAIGRLSDGAKLPGMPQLTRPLRLPDGNTIENVSFGAAVKLLQKYSEQLASATLPDFKLPVWSKQQQKERKERGEKDPDPFIDEAIIADVDALVVPPRDLRVYARNDRVVTWTRNGGLSVYEVGGKMPLGANSTIQSEARGCAWIGAELLVWTDDSVSLLKGDEAGTLWTASMSTLPPVDTTVEEPDVTIAGGQQQQRQEFIRGQIILDGQGQPLIRRGRAIRVLQQPVAPPQQRADGPEKITHVGAIGDRMAFATNRGRIVALELSNGNVAWQTRVSESPLLQFLTTDDFIAFRYVDERGMQIVTLDTYTGQVVHSRAFTGDGGQVPQNMALALDGTLLYTLPDRLCAKDLYEPKKELKFGEQATVENNAAFSGLSLPEQLIVADGRVLAVSDAGQVVRVLSLEDGREFPPPLATGMPSANPNVWLRVVGPRLYCIGQKSFSSYNLDHPDENSSPAVAVPTSTRDAFVGKRHLMLLDQATGSNGEQPGQAPRRETLFRLLGYARYSPEGKTGESGKLDCSHPVRNPLGIDPVWQPVEGGFYYRSGDRKLHFLRGIGDAN